MTTQHRSTCRKVTREKSASTPQPSSSSTSSAAVPSRPIHRWRRSVLLLLLLLVVMGVSVPVRWSLLLRRGRWRGRATTTGSFAALPGVADVTGVGDELFPEEGGGQVRRRKWEERRKGGERGRKAYLFRLDTVLYTLDDAPDDRLVVSLELVVSEPKHLPRLPRLVPHDFDNAVVVLFFRGFPSVRSPPRISISSRSLRRRGSRREREEEGRRTHCSHVSSSISIVS
jgi:hypothetical protein